VRRNIGIRFCRVHRDRQSDTVRCGYSGIRVGAFIFHDPFLLIVTGSLRAAKMRGSSNEHLRLRVFFSALQLPLMGNPLRRHLLRAQRTGVVYSTHPWLIIPLPSGHSMSSIDPGPTIRCPSGR
jgi:hypothetical protein